jgi:hypothetical protein
MSVRWFGPSWGAPINTLTAPFPTPVGERCTVCGEPILVHDQGFVLPYFGSPEEGNYVVYHRDCLLISVGVRT